MGVGNPRALIGPRNGHDYGSRRRDSSLSVSEVTMSSTINMAFARRPSLGFSTRLLLFPTTSTPTISLIAQRHLSTSRRTLQAQPAHNHSHDSSKSPRLGTGIYSAKDEQGKYVNPYEGGPSALEKAAHLFFFTEIARGWFIATTVPVLSPPYLNIPHPRHVAGLGTVLPSPIHNHVPF